MTLQRFFGRATAGISDEHRFTIATKHLGHGEIDEEVEEAADHSGDVLDIVKEEIMRRCRAADLAVSRP